MQIKYSIIIPHYNSVRSLKELLVSIPRREDIQVIVVDDNSTADADMLAQVIKDDKRCEFFVNDTGIQSAGACRNTGLQHAAGKWILFADSDDYFLPDFLGIITEHYDNPADIIYFVPAGVNQLTGKKSSRCYIFALLIDDYTKKRSKKSENNLRFRYVVPWSKMFRHSLIKEHNIRFETVMYANDVMFSTVTALHASSIYAARGQIYCVTEHGKSLSAKKSEPQIDVRADVLLRRYDLLKKSLSNKELRQLDISGNDLIFKSLKWFGIRKMLGTIKKLRAGGVKLFCFSPLNIKLALRMCQEGVSGGRFS